MPLIINSLSLRPKRITLLHYVHISYVTVKKIKIKYNKWIYHIVL